MLANFRAKYPGYGDLSDDELGAKLAAKYPQYRNLAPATPAKDESGFTLSGVVDLAKEVGTPAIAPTIGAAIGTGVGGAIGGPVGAKLLESAGSFAGEGFNQLTGITEPSWAQMGMAAVAPPISRLLLGSTQAAATTMPGRRATAEALNTNAFDAAKSMTGKYQPQGPAAKDLFALARQQQVMIPVPKALTVIDDALVSIAKNPETRDLSRPLETHLKELRTQLAGHGGQIPPDLIQDKIHQISLRVNALQGDNVKELGKLANQVKAGLLDDLDTAAASGLPNSGPAQNLIQARATYLREQSVKDLESAIKDASKLKRGQSTEQFNANRVIDEMRDSPFYERAFNKAERKEIEDLLVLLNQVPVLPAPRGQSIGSGRTLGMRGLGGGMTATTATAMGADPTTAGMLGLAVAGAPYVVDWKHNVAMMLATPQGRQVLTNMVKGGGLSKGYRATAVGTAGVTGSIGELLRGSE